MMYFRFFPDVIWVKGRVRSTLYELSDRKVTHLTASDTDILFSLMDHSIEETKMLFPQADVDTLLEHLICCAVGSIYNGVVYAEPYLPHMPFELKGYLEPLLIIDELTLELFPLDAYGVHESKPLLIFQGCNSCIPSTLPQRNSDEVCAEILSELAELDEIPIRRVKMHIGVPEGHYDAFRQILQCCEHEQNVAVEFVLYLEKISDETINFVAEYENSTLVICCSDVECQSERERIHDMVLAATNRGIRTVLSVIYLHNMPDSPHSAITEIAASLGVQLRTTELLRSSEDHVFSVARGQERLEVADSSAFYFRSKYSLCKYGKLSINCNGRISGCLHDHVAPSQSRGLFEFLAKSGHQFSWEMPKQTVAVCMECENRFACVDCNIIEQALSEHPEYINMICKYKTCDGKWSV